MRTFVGAHEARDGDEFIELALGTPLELWLGVEDETPEERAARLDAGRDILADDPGLIDRVTRVAALAIEEHAADLFAPAVPRQAARRIRRAVAA
ncbi:hypothetical protein [Streptomyces sp. 8K308]|uniref:hypothetical protein n=1 Tax=Streptomyces sp. 8K308 TaxID=2530388 RepID=UPI001A9EF0A1|nr:hypothetical protein [Streptomyces sp. 8K308]